MSFNEKELDKIAEFKENDSYNEKSKTEIFPTSDKMSNHIEEYFAKVEGSKEAFNSRELFKAERENVDIKTDLSLQEIHLLNKLMFNDDFLINKGLKPAFQKFYYSYMRLKISLDRKSRQEFVGINRADNSDDVLSKMSNMSNIIGGNVRK